MIDTITQNDLDLHAKWTRSEPDGVRLVAADGIIKIEADLSGADLSRADLRGAKNIPDYVIAVTSILPAGDLIGWKKLKNGLIAKLLITADAKRSNATGRKCRADYSKEVLEIWDGDTQVQTGVSQHDADFVYTVGQQVRVLDFCEDRWQECAAGVHFFITRYEAENY